MAQYLTAWSTAVDIWASSTVVAVTASLGICAVRDAQLQRFTAFGSSVWNSAVWTHCTLASTWVVAQAGVMLQHCVNNHRLRNHRHSLLEWPKENAGIIFSLG